MANPHPFPIILRFNLPSGALVDLTVTEQVTFQDLVDRMRQMYPDSPPNALEYEDEVGDPITVRTDDEVTGMLYFYYKEIERRGLQSPFPLDVRPRKGRLKNPGLRINTQVSRRSAAPRPGSGSSQGHGGIQSQRQPQATLEDILSSGQITQDDLRFLKVLGHGNGGTVYQASHLKARAIMAVKMITVNVSKEVQREIMAELGVLHRCNSEYIIRFYGAFFCENRISVCTEYMDGGSLDKLRPIQEDILGRMAVAVVKGLLYLQELKIMHRDIKPSNMLVNTQGQVKLCDFGVSVQLVNSTANTFVGTNAYMAPERVQGGKYSFLSEIWSFGISLVEMAIGRFPYPADGNITREIRPFELLSMIVHEPPPSLPPEHFSPPFIDLCWRCTQKVPDARLRLSSMLGHPFLAQLNDGNIEVISVWVIERLQAIQDLKQAAFEQTPSLQRTPLAESDDRSQEEMAVDEPAPGVDQVSGQSLEYELSTSYPSPPPGQT